jgi:hypothetical protein
MRSILARVLSLALVGDVAQAQGTVGILDAQSDIGRTAFIKWWSSAARWSLAAP